MKKVENINLLDAATVKSMTPGEISLYDAHPETAKALEVTGMFTKDLHDANFAMLANNLAKLHAEAYQPLHYVTFMEDVPVVFGGGFVDKIEYRTINWYNPTSSEGNLYANNGTDIPRVNASANQLTVNVHLYQIAYDMKFVEMEKLNTIGFTRSLQDIYANEIAAGYDLFAQGIAYEGVNTAHGLFNSPNVKAYTIPVGASNKNGIDNLTDEEVISFINGIFAFYLTNTNNNLDMLPDTLLVPMSWAKELSSRTSDLYVKNLRNYILQNNLGVDEMTAAGKGSYSFKIRGRVQLDTAGTANIGRIVAYKNEQRYVRMDQPVSLMPYITMPNIERMAYTTTYVASISDIQMPYNDGNNAGEFGPVTYWDVTTN